MNNFIKNLVVALVGLLLLGFGFLGGYHMKEPEVVPVTVEKEVPKIVYVNKTVEVPVIRYVNNTIVKEVPKEVVVEKEVIKEPALDFKNSIVEYLKVNFSECEGFDYYGFAEEEITDVILTHLHFDHAGGIVSIIDNKKELTFPNAIHVIQQKEWEIERS